MKPTVFATGLNFPEGPAFDRQGNLFAVNNRGQDVYKITPDGRVSVFLRTGGQPNGLAFDRKGDLYLAEWGLRAVMRITPDARMSVFVDSYSGVRLHAPNDIVFDPEGNMYFTDPIRYPEPDPCISPVYKVTPRGRISLVAEGFHFPNGIGLSPDAQTLYVAETRANRISRLAIKADGSFGKPEPFAYLGEGAKPDGMCLDEDGNIVQSLFGNGKILVVSPEGKILDSYETGGPHCTNVCFGGPDLKTLYATVPGLNAIVTFPYPRRGLRLFPDR